MRAILSTPRASSRQTHCSLSVQRQITHARPLQTFSGCTGAAHLQRWLPGRGRLGSWSQVTCRTPLKGTQARVLAPARQAAGAPRTLHARAVIAVVQRHGRQLDLLRHGHLVLRRARLPEAAAPAAARSLPQAHQVHAQHTKQHHALRMPLQQRAPHCLPSAASRPLARPELSCKNQGPIRRAPVWPAPPRTAAA